MRCFLVGTVTCIGQPHLTPVLCQNCLSPIQKLQLLQLVCGRSQRYSYVWLPLKKLHMRGQSTSNNRPVIETPLLNATRHIQLISGIMKDKRCIQFGAAA